jgi:multiple sugar transport system substrate-binding protein
MNRARYGKAGRLGWIVLLLVAGSFVAYAAGKQEQGGAAAGPVTLVYNNFSAGETNAKVLNDMLELFRKKYPNITVTNDAMGYGDSYWTQLTTRIAGGTAPDAFEVNMENFIPYVTRGVMLPLDAYYAAAGVKSGLYSKAVLDACTYQGKIYAVPQSFSTVVLVYNKDLFDKAGAAYPTESWKWADAVAAAQKIRALGPDIWGLYNPIQFWEFYKVVRQNGGSLLSEDGKRFMINSPQNVETLQYMVDRIRKYDVMPDKVEQADRTESDLFVEGKLAMWLNGVWSFSEIQKRAPAGLRWGVEVEPGNTAKATHFFANVSAISPTSKHPTEAFQLLHFLASDPEVVALRLKAQWELPTVSDEKLVQSYIQATPPDNKKAVFRSLEYVVRPPALKQFNELANLVTTKLEAARDGALTPKEALDQAQAEAERTIKLE